jgi:hypothetical protein
LDLLALVAFAVADGTAAPAFPAADNGFSGWLAVEEPAGNGLPPDGAGEVLVFIKSSGMLAAGAEV